MANLGRIKREGLSETQKMRLHFWEELHEDLSLNSTLSPQKPSHEVHMDCAQLGGGIRLSAFIKAREEQIVVNLILGNTKNRTYYFHELESQKEDIEKELGYSLDWIPPLPGPQGRLGQQGRIMLHRSSSPLADKSRWPEYREWMKEQFEAFDRVFRPRVSRL